MGISCPCGDEDRAPNRADFLVSHFFDPDRRRQSAEAARKIGFYTTIPAMLLVGPVLGYLLGSWLEHRFGHAPWFVLGGVTLGFVASVRQVIRVLRQAE
jgi:ATP synthase protein I